MKENFTLNNITCSVNDLNPGCKQVWSLGQQEAIRRLSIKTRVEFKQPPRYELVENFSARAERIAGNYAKIYLELECNGKPEKKGRFYWTGLAAFASKQVMCALDYATDSNLRYLAAPILLLNKTKDYLGKGNFWLFQDIFVWHWFYINHPEQFKACVGSRNWNDFSEGFQSTAKSLPWVDSAPSEARNFETNEYVERGFELVSKTEKVGVGKTRERYQYESLMAIANHEQRKILQPLIYDSWVFQRLLDSQALMEGHIGIPRRLAAMSTMCETGSPDYDIVMTKGKLHNENERMDFISQIADRYHQLMLSEPEYMENSIETISTWSEHV
ncbi:DUF2515 family protein [Pseudomonas sp. NPDC090233]|uniref:DUF2515 family protein n=1 Tax=Pseudomonas sp. NPDC090233 TaxID=3364479 RepID=UPI00383ADF49